MSETRASEAPPRSRISGLAAGGEDRRVGGIVVRWLHDGLVGVTHWRCMASTRALSEERQQLFHVAAFVHRGCFVRHRGRSAALADPTSVLFYNPGDPYRTSHPHGCGDFGSALALRPDLLRALAAEHDPRMVDAPEPRFVASQAVAKRETGVTLHGYVAGLRLRAALEELAKGCPDLGLLALELGFSSHSHFSAAFRQEFGRPPSAARRLPAAGWPARRARGPSSTPSSACSGGTP
jgi:hypothetical protein